MYFAGLKKALRKYCSLVTFTARMGETLIEMATLAILTYPSAAVTKCISRTNYAVIVNGKKNRNMIFLQDGEYGRSDLSPHEVDMSQVWFFVKYQLLDFLCRLKVVEIVYQVFYLLEGSASCFFRFWEILAER